MEDSDFPTLHKAVPSVPSSATDARGSSSREEEDAVTQNDRAMRDDCNHDVNNVADGNNREERYDVTSETVNTTTDRLQWNVPPVRGLDRQPLADASRIANVQTDSISLSEPNLPGRLKPRLTAVANYANEPRDTTIVTGAQFTQNWLTQPHGCENAGAFEDASVMRSLRAPAIAPLDSTQANANARSWTDFSPFGAQPLENAVPNALFKEDRGVFAMYSNSSNAATGPSRPPGLPDPSALRAAAGFYVEQPERPASQPSALDAAAQHNLPMTLFREVANNQCSFTAALHSNLDSSFPKQSFPGKVKEVKESLSSNLLPKSINFLSVSSSDRAFKESRLASIAMERDAEVNNNQFAEKPVVQNVLPAGSACRSDAVRCTL